MRRAAGHRVFVSSCSILGLALLASCDVSTAIDESRGVEDRGPLPPPGVDRISFGLTPFLGQDQTLARARPLVDYLARAVGVRVEAHAAESYEDLVRMAAVGEADLVALSPLAYVKALSRGAKLRILATPVEQGSPTYLGYVIVRAADSQYRRVSDLRGTRFAFVAPTSTSGYLYARALLREYGIDPDADLGSAVMAGSHPAVISAVLEGRADAGAIGSSIIDVTGEPLSTSEGLRVIGKTARIPFDAYCVRSDLDDATARRIQRALLAVAKSARLQQQVANPLAFSGWIVGDDTRYDSVRRALALERRGAR